MIKQQQQQQQQIKGSPLSLSILQRQIRVTSLFVISGSWLAHDHGRMRPVTVSNSEANEWHWQLLMHPQSFLAWFINEAFLMLFQ